VFCINVCISTVASCQIYGSMWHVHLICFILGKNTNAKWRQQKRYATSNSFVGAKKYETKQPNLQAGNWKRDRRMKSDQHGTIWEKGRGTHSNTFYNIAIFSLVLFVFSDVTHDVFKNRLKDAWPNKHFNKLEWALGRAHTFTYHKIRHWIMNSWH